MPEAERTWLVVMWLTVNYILLLVLTISLCSLTVLTFKERRRAQSRPRLLPIPPPSRLLLPEEQGALLRHVTAYKSTGTGETCTICYEELEATQRVVRLPVCLHVFHYKCIREWLAIKAVCPCCKGDVLCALGLEIN